MKKSDVRPRPLGWAGGDGLVFRVRWLITGLLCIVALGCGGSGKSYRQIPTDPAYPVKGRVLLSDGKPAKTGTVIFQPVERSGIEARGKIGNDGSFALTSRNDGDGALSGEYNFVVVIPPVRKDLTKYAKYANTETPLLKATVSTSANALEPFRLK